MALPGIIKEHPNFRDGPSLDSDVLRVLEPGTLVDVMERHGDYFRVRAADQIGYVHVDYILPNPGGPVGPDAPLEPPAPSPPPAAAGSLAAEPDFAASPLAPAPERALQSGLSVALVWNQYGALLETLSRRIGIDASIAVATLAVESGGRSAGQDGRLIIRFENHIFHQYWGAQHQALFDQHFSYDANQTWQGHQWRPAVDESWRACHVDLQSAEWGVFNYACTLDENAAKLSISMGLTQVMGFNHATLGYASPLDMFDAFARGPRYQVIGFFDFVQRNGAVPALQSADYATFARIYNGSGQVDAYSGLIRGAVDQLRAMMPVAVTRRRAAPHRARSGRGRDRP